MAIRKRLKSPVRKEVVRKLCAYMRRTGLPTSMAGDHLLAAHNIMPTADELNEAFRRVRGAD